MLLSTAGGTGASCVVWTSCKLYVIHALLSRAAGSRVQRSIAGLIVLGRVSYIFLRSPQGFPLSAGNIVTVA